MNFKFSVSVILFFLSLLLIALATYFCGNPVAPIEEDEESATVSKNYMPTVGPTLSTILRDESKNNVCYLTMNQNCNFEVTRL